MTPERTNYLELADWRRRVATLYAEVRSRAAADPAAALVHWRAVRAQLYRTHPRSPVPIHGRENFPVQHFPHDPALRFEAPVIMEGVEPEPNGGHGVEGGRAVLIPTSTGADMVFQRLGWVDIPFPEGRRRLGLYWLEGYADGLYLPFGDATNGVDTYGAGRYLLDGAKSADLGGDVARGTLIIDFNFAYHPSCAFDPRWACPLIPPENRLDLPIRAGERMA